MLLPRRGFFVIGELDDTATRKVVVPCKPPANERCPGNQPNITSWTESDVFCGKGYTDYVCSKCASGFFSDNQGGCEQCQDADEELDLGAIMMSLGFLVLGLVLLFGACVALGYTLGLPASITLVSSAEFMVYVSSSMQVVLAVAWMRPKGLPIWYNELMQVCRAQQNVLKRVSLFSQHARLPLSRLLLCVLLTGMA